MTENDKTGELLIDPFLLAREGGVKTGSLAVMAMGRLLELLATSEAPDFSGELVSVPIDREAELQYRLQGQRSATGYTASGVMRLQINGELHLRCQRCLLALPHTLAIDKRLLLTPAGRQLSESELESMEADGSEVVQVILPLSVVSLVEDEVLLALPLYPRHQVCQPPEYTCTSIVGDKDVESGGGGVKAVTDARRKFTTFSEIGGRS